MNNEVKVSVPKYMAENVVIYVRAVGVNAAIWRLKLALPLVWLACKIGGVGMQVDLQNAERWHR